MIKAMVVNSEEKMLSLLNRLGGDELITVLPYGRPEDYSYLIIYREEV